MKFKTWVGICLSLLLLLAGAQDSTSEKKVEIPTSQVGVLIKGVNYKIDQGRSFQLVHISSLEKKYLFVSLSSDAIYAHLELNLTIYKQGAQTPLKSCIKQEVDACYLPREQLQANETIFIVVDSGNEQCQYQLQTYWSNLEHIIPGNEVRFMFSKQEKKQIYHLELQGAVFQELRIIIKPQTFRFAFDKVKMFGTFGKDSLPSANNYDFKSVYLWQDAEGIYLTKKEIKDLSMNFILEGETQTVYTLRCELVDKLHSDLQLNNKIYEYFEKDESYTYHIAYKNSQGKLEYDSYVFTLATFTGDLNIQFYEDRERTKSISTIEPFMYMGDIQYLFTKKEIQSKMPQGLYIKTLSKNKISTFMMEVEGRSQSKMFQIHEHIYEFIPVQKKTLSYFQVSRFDEGNTKKQNMKVVLTLIQVYGTVGIEFRKCTSQKESCLGELYSNHSTSILSQYRSVGSKETYTITLADDFWKNVNQVEKAAVILVVLVNKHVNSSSFASIEYNVGNKPQFLRENKPIQSHVLKAELKVYKFVTTDKNIEKVRIHINKINGCFSTYVFRHEPSEEQLIKDANKVSGALFETNSKLTDEPIVIVIRGQDSATYSLIVQPVYKDQKELNYITLSEDVQFKIKIAPNHYEVFQIVPIMNKIFFNYKSSGAVHVCVLKNNVCEDKEANFTNQGTIVRQNAIDRSIYVKLRNPSSTKSIQVTSLFHSKQDQHCQQKKIGHLYRQIVKQGSCFLTTIDTAQDFEVLIARQEVGHLSYTMALCDKFLNFAIKQNGEERYIVSADQITANCQGHAQYTFLFVASGGKSSDPEKPLNIHLKYLVEYTTGIVVLPDGIGYHGTEVTTEQPIKKFAFPLINKGDTSVILSTQHKLYFLIKFIDAGMRAQTTMSITQYDLSSPSEKFYYLQSIFLKVSQENILKSKCEDCQLLIYVYSKERVGTQVDYTIEVTQNFIKLEEGVPKSGYLIENSKAYYGFPVKSSGSLLVEVADNNRNCAEIYLSTLQYPDENRHLQKSFDGQMIIEVPKSINNYYITVRARKTCPYTITAALTPGKNHIVKLERGVLGYCNLMENEIKLYTFKHLSDQAFKVISLHKYGHVEFYLNKTTPDGILALMRQDKINLQDFSFHSDFKNRLTLDKSKAEFCKGCFYVLAVKAIKHTESSIFLGDQSTKIPMSDEKVINDILSTAGATTRGDFYFFKAGVLQVKVHNGKLQVQIIYNDQSIKKTFSKSKKLVSQNFTLSESEKAYGSVTVIFTALENNTIYSSRIKSADTIESDKDGHHYLKIDSNEPNYLYLSKAQLSCVTGFLKRADERLFISFYSQDKESAKQIKIIGKLNGNQTTISRDTTRNIISIAFIEVANQDLKESIPYELCFSHEKQSLSLTITQTEQTSLLPENLEVLVVKKQTFDISPEGKFLLDVFQCRGTSKIKYGRTKKEMETSEPQNLNTIGMSGQSHATELSEGYGNLFLEVEAEMALIRWMPIIKSKHKGMGYYIYSAGGLRYDSAFGQISFLVDPVKLVKETETKVENVKYNLYVSNSEKDLQQASHCERYLPDSVMEYKTLPSSSLSNNKTFKFVTSKVKFMERYKESSNLFFNVVADLSLKTPDGQVEEYRFIYESKELPAEIFLPSQLQQYNFTTLIVVLVLFILAILIFTWLFVKVIVPLIGRLRNRQLVEENGREDSKDRKEEGEKQEHMDPPPSSDRQGINMDIVVPETQQKM